MAAQLIPAAAIITTIQQTGHISEALSRIVESFQQTERCRVQAQLAHHQLDHQHAERMAQLQFVGQALHGGFELTRSGQLSGEQYIELTSRILGQRLLP